MKELFVKYRNWIYILIILVAGYSLYSEYISERNSWDESDKKALTKKCMNDLGKLALEYPEPAYNYCTCTTDIIVQEINRNKYFEMVNDSSYSNIKFVSETLSPCYAKLKEQTGL